MRTFRWLFSSDSWPPCGPRVPKIDLNSAKFKKRVQAHGLEPCSANQCSTKKHRKLVKFNLSGNHTQCCTASTLTRYCCLCNSMQYRKWDFHNLSFHFSSTCGTATGCIWCYLNSDGAALGDPYCNTEDGCPVEREAEDKTTEACKQQ